MTGLDALSWPSVPPGATVLLPIGSTEQHGPHLPFDTDSVIARAVASVVGERMRSAGDPVVVAPVLAYGASGEHQSFPGTISIGHEALRFVLIELVRSLSTWAARVVIVNGHGGNVATLVSAVPQLRAENHGVAWLPCAVPAPERGAASRAGEAGALADAPAVPAGSVADAPAGLGGSVRDAHAGRTETSLMLHLAPTAVRLPLPGAGNTAPMTELLPLLAAGGVAAVSESGILGDPSGATAAEGAALFDAMVTDALRRVAADAPDPRGMLR
ncbi:mycofactocin biosynthesis peptidyl-dipeptidase MftE [Herbiconiux sp. CPCC 205763]|uniref:Mycofactocin biosynthesis peptidyl-dipeptidase MftE n=1 Tax=Herbiconiux aconitum TaxID=2970913 RepID=A0ABT2GUR0_9MICO|nr:mycofactocin biosynthesis peptidyl-dipeptidase MftE [Herbiconiux aconitum]MCS5719951.1 mycofactocin biosynthesis peptidyl-dipeptidase MftE [Herbiconiux aconitum]